MAGNNQILDIRDYFSPLSVLKVRSALDTMENGQILEVWSNDFETKTVLKQIMKNSDDELLRSVNTGEYEKIYIKRRAPEAEKTGDIAPLLTPLVYESEKNRE